MDDVKEIRNKIPYLCVKFGKKEHLEGLKNGNIFFTRIEEFLKDETDFRGDKNEGSVFIDPSEFDIIVDGKSIFKDGRIPLPDTIKQTCEHDETVHVFCCSVLRGNVWNGEETKHFSDDFKVEMNRFGDYVLIFNINELIDNISEVTFENNIGCIADYVVYKDIYSDFEPIEFSTEDAYNRFFVKDTKYKNQNEYRIIVDGTEDFLKSNCEKGYLLKTKPLKSAILMEADVFLETTTIEMQD